MANKMVVCWGIIQLVILVSASLRNNHSRRGSVGGVENEQTHQQTETVSFLLPLVAFWGYCTNDLSGCEYRKYRNNQ